jgi:NAD dependent epimerase/dehydratase
MGREGSESMKVLVTGAGGFIGSHLVEKCLALGYEVKAFVRYNSRNTWGWLETVSARDQLEVLTGDIRDADSVSKAMKDCNAVFHLAALIGIPYSYVSPLAYIKTNIEGTYNVLEAAKTLGLESVLVTSTSETYGTAQYVPIDERHPLVGQSPYSASKIGADQLALSYYRSFGVPVKIVRPFNTYGPRQSARAVISTIITQILSGAKKIKLGNLSPTRDLTFVKDTVEGFIAIHQCPSLVGEVTNIGMNQEISIGGLARLISKRLKTDIEIAGDESRVRPENSEVERLWCDNTKLRDQTGWKPKYDLQRGLEETIDWVKTNFKLYKADIYNV